MKKKKVIVTGGAGFIGSNLAEELALRGHQVVIIDNLSTGNLENIQPVLPVGQVDFIEGSITNLPLMQKAFSGADYVFHQAALPSVPRSIEDPETTDSVNITGTLNVLIAARDNAVKKLVFASSSSVYGDTPTLPKTEDMPPNPLPKSPANITARFLPGFTTSRRFACVTSMSTDRGRTQNRLTPRLFRCLLMPFYRVSHPLFSATASRRETLLSSRMLSRPISRRLKAR